jgi:hypothetical protein
MVPTTVSCKRGMNMLVCKCETYSSLKQRFRMTLWIDGIRRLTTLSRLLTERILQADPNVIESCHIQRRSQCVSTSTSPLRLSVSKRASSQNLRTVEAALTNFWHSIEIVLTSTNTLHTWNWQVGIHVPMTISCWSFEWFRVLKNAVRCEVSSVSYVRKFSFWLEREFYVK